MLVTSLAAFLLDLAVPAFLVLLSVRSRPRSRLEGICRGLLPLGYALFLNVVFPSIFFGVWLRILITVLLVAAALVVGVRKIPGATGAWRIAGVGLCATAGLLLFGIAVRAVVVGYPCPSEWLDLRSPFREGTWCVVSGGGSLWINTHNVPNQIYGMDIVRVNGMGKTAHGLLPLSEKFEDYPTFGSDLLSPCDGVILFAEDGNEDYPPGQLPARNTAGNLILLGHGRYKILMGHLKKGSVRVHEGDVVTKGQLLAQCGNSGHASFPHLHISFAVGGLPKAPYSGTGVPAKFDGRFLVRNSFLGAAPVH
jgi:hypothetical protein